MAIISPFAAFNLHLNLPSLSLKISHSAGKTKPPFSYGMFLVYPSIKNLSDSTLIRMLALRSAQTKIWVLSQDLYLLSDT
jgi:hypothetical protein